MKPVRRLQLLFSLFLLVFLGLHVYLWIRLVRDTAPPEPFFALFTAAIVLLGVAAPLAILFRVPALQRVIYLWMGTGFIMVLGAVRSRSGAATVRRGGSERSDP